MKLYFQIQNYNWQPERYKYSVEQMMLMLFPGERPEYPEEHLTSDNEAVFSLDRGLERTTVTARVTRPEGTAQGETQVESPGSGVPHPPARPEDGFLSGGD